MDLPGAVVSGWNSPGSSPVGETAARCPERWAAPLVLSWLGRVFAAGGLAGSVAALS